MPNILLGFLETISTFTQPILPPQTYDLLFPLNHTRARQAIINIYHAGELEGFTPHIDVLGLFRVLEENEVLLGLRILWENFCIAAIAVELID
jgi:hypothetical protein